MRRKILFSGAALFAIASSASGCIIHSCNPSIHYAMSKERGALSKRLGELIRGIRVMKEKNKAINKLYKKEIKELHRLDERYKIRVVDLKSRTHSLQKQRAVRNANAAYHTTTIK